MTGLPSDQKGTGTETLGQVVMMLVVAHELGVFVSRLSPLLESEGMNPHRKGPHASFSLVELPVIVLSSV